MSTLHRLLWLFIALAVLSLADARDTPSKEFEALLANPLKSFGRNLKPFKVPFSPGKDSADNKSQNLQAKTIERRSLLSGCGDGEWHLNTWQLGPSEYGRVTCTWPKACETVFSYEMSVAYDDTYQDTVDIFVTDGGDCAADLFSRYDNSNRHYTEHFVEEKSNHTVSNQRVAGQNATGNFCVLVKCNNPPGTFACDQIDFKVKMSCADSASTGGSMNATKSDNCPKDWMDEAFTNSCGSKEVKTDKWCEGVCYAFDESECCERAPVAQSDNCTPEYADSAFTDSCGSNEVKTDKWCEGVCYAWSARSCCERAPSTRTCDIRFGDEAFTGSCGGLSVKSDKWCEGVCYAQSASECCDVDGGALAGIIVACVVVLTLLIVGCCKCYSCCCFQPKDEMHQADVVMVTPASVQMQPGLVQMQQSPNAPK